MRLMFHVSVLVAGLSAATLYAADTTPYDLIRPVYPMAWDTSSVVDGGTVLSFSKFAVNKDDTLLGTPKVGSKPADFKANGYISDSLDQAYIDALNLKIANIRVNQAGYLSNDPEKQFYYTTSRNCAEVSYSVVDLDGKELAKGSSLTSTGASAGYTRSVNAFANAMVNRYTVDVSEVDSTKRVCVGKLGDAAGLPNNQRLRIKVDKEYSSTFIISDNVYSMLRDAALKFFGAQRSGNSESWFHGPSHLKDTIPGGWYDAGDYVKQGPTMTYAFMMLSALATLRPDRDEDHYAFNHSETVNTDGIPDILREARYGAEFFLRSYELAKGHNPENMAVTVGIVRDDHLLWDRPENMDSRSDAKPRPLFYGIGPAFSGSIAAGLAFLSQSYAAYDKAFADSCLKVAEELYAYGKANKDAGEVCEKEAYPCVQEPEDELAMAAIALHYATYEKTKKMDYMTDLTSDKTINDNSSYHRYNPVFEGGWFGIKKGRGFNPGGWPSDYQNVHSIALYAFYKLFLADSSTSEKYGLSDSLRKDYSKRTIDELARNAAWGLNNSEGSIIALPYGDRTENLRYSAPWYNFGLHSWGPNSYDAGEVMTMLAYAEISGNAQVRQIAINKMNAFLGMNRWDISFVIGVGDKNESHPNSRMANPEIWNGSMLDLESQYKLPPYHYCSLVGAFLGGAPGDSLISDAANFVKTETGLWYNAVLLADAVLLAADRPAVLPKDTTKTDTTKVDTTKVDTTKVDTTKVDTTKVDTTKADTTKVDTTKADTTKKDPAKADTTKKDPAKADTTKKDPAKADTTKKDPAKADTTKKDPAKADTTKKDKAKDDSSKKDGIPSVLPAGASHFEIANHGNVLDVNYVLPTARNVRVSLVSIKGKTMKLYTPGQQSAGRHALRWNMEQVPAGVYLVEYRAGSAREIRTVRIGL